jgi:hypothetical protein
MKKALLSLQEVTEMFNQRTLVGLLSNAEKSILNLDESKNPIKEYIYIFRVLGSYCEKVSKGLDAYGRAYERISLSDPRQQALFMSFCYVIGIADKQDQRLNTLSKEGLEIFNKNIKVAKRTYEALFEINYEMHRYLKSVQENDLDLFELEKSVHKVYDLVQDSSSDEALNGIYSLLLKVVSSLQKNEALSTVAQTANELCEKAAVKLETLYSEEKAIFYNGQLESCISIMRSLYSILSNSSLRDADFLITKRFLDLTLVLMHRYYGEIDKEHLCQDRFVFAKRSSLGKMDKRETIYLENIAQYLGEIKKGNRIENPNLEKLPSMTEYTEAFVQYLDRLNESSLLDEKPTLSP